MNAKQQSETASTAFHTSIPIAESPSYLIETAVCATWLRRSPLFSSYSAGEAALGLLWNIMKQLLELSGKFSGGDDCTKEAISRRTRSGKPTSRTGAILVRYNAVAVK